MNIIELLLTNKLISKYKMNHKKRDKMGDSRG